MHALKALTALLLTTTSVLATPLPATPDDKTITIQGTPYDYQGCAAMREAGNKACEAVPEYRPDGGPVRYQCIDANVNVANECVVAFDQGAKLWHYGFQFKY
ncbi:hypothetical protein HDU96_005199 [Phlyctochytrium bullatum]|nr:hypothetical protein HDU96_005199 [Phlyctochytrium bullatum]